MILVTFIWMTAIISTSLSCLVSIDNVYLADNSGETITIEAKNSNNSDNIFSYPGWKIYVNNVMFGKHEVFYYAIGNYPTEFTITSNTTTIMSGARVSLYIELWTVFYSQLECTFDTIGIIDTKNASNTTTSIAYPYIKCPATIKRIYANDPIGDSLIIEIANNPSQNSNNEIFSYPSITVYTINNDVKYFFGESGVDYYGIGDYNQSFPVRSNRTTIQPDQQTDLYIELWIGFNGVKLKACTFHWSGNIPLITSSPTKSPTENPTDATPSPTDNTKYPSSAPTTEIDGRVWCSDTSVEDDTTSCVDGTCKCANGAQCKNNECVEYKDPNAGIKQSALQVVMYMIMVVVIM